MSMAYMLPQPPETSWTRSWVGDSFSDRMAAMADSAGVMLGSSAAAASADKRVREAEKERQWYDEGAGVERCRRVGAARARTRDEDEGDDEAMADGDAAAVRRALRAARRQAVQIILGEAREWRVQLSGGWDWRQ